MTREKAEKIARGIIDKIECNTADIDDWAEFWGFTREEYEDFLDMAIKVSEPKTGHWQHYEGMLICSECGTEFYDDIMEYCGDDVPKCCPDCGCRMVEPQESDYTCHTCHTCKHYTSGERDGSCGSYICKGYSDWESEE